MKKFIPLKRLGTKSFLDVPRELKEKDFASVSGKHFMEVIPPTIREYLYKAIMETGLESVEALKWLEYVLSNDVNTGKPVSPIAQWVNTNPYNPKAFKYIYQEEPALSAFDHGYIITSGAQGIYSRLQSLVDRLPDIIRSEGLKFNLGQNEKYVIYNLGSAQSLDTIYAIYKNLDLINLVRIVCVDPDEESLGYGQRLAEKLGVAECFEFIPKKIGDAELTEAHLMLFIGMFCPIPTEKCIFTLQLVKNYVKDNGIIIFSTVQEKMLMGGPILDFIMWSCGWRMHFKSDDEPGQIAQLAGYHHDKAMDWEDEFGYNRITVARKKK